MDFIRDGNIRRFKKMLARETDPTRRGTIEKLLEEELEFARGSDAPALPNSGATDLARGGRAA